MKRVRSLAGLRFSRPLGGVLGLAAVAFYLPSLATSAAGGRPQRQARRLAGEGGSGEGVRSGAAGAGARRLPRRALAAARETVVAAIAPSPPSGRPGSLPRLVSSARR